MLLESRKQEDNFKLLEQIYWIEVSSTFLVMGILVESIFIYFE